MRLLVEENYEELSRVCAEKIVEVVRNKPDAILGLATGSTPEGVYKYLIKYYEEGLVDFSKVTTFNLDEYVGLPANDPNSYRYYMNDKLFKHINVKPENIHIPNGTSDNYEEECREYDKLIEDMGGIDLQLLGIGNNGHIGFNEPSSFLYRGTHITDLTEETIKANSRFFEDEKDVPRKAITMGIGNILHAKSIILIANGYAKSDIIADIIEGNITTTIPASVLHLHSNVLVITDEQAASKLNKSHCA